MTTPSWYLDELDYAGEEHLDPEYVPTYDHKAGTDPSVDLAKLQAFGFNSTHTLVDMGAGTGTFALAVAPHCRRVIAVDVSSVMLNQLRQKAQQTNITNLDSIQGGFLTYQHQGDLADFVYSRHALHHLSDFWKAIAIQQIANIMKPGGVFHLRDLIFSCQPDEIDSVIDSWLANASDTPEVGWTRDELITHIQQEYSTFNWLLEAMLEHAGFEIREVNHSDIKIFSEYICFKR